MISKKEKRVYLDWAASSLIFPEALKTLTESEKKYFANPNSSHYFGQQAKVALEKARERIAREINADFEEIIFTSSATEANNLAIKGFLESSGKRGQTILISGIEHDSVKEPAISLRKKGFNVEELKVDKEGFVDLAYLEKRLQKGNVVLVSVISASNEIGTIQPIDKIGTLCKKYGALFHTDAAQAFLKENIDVKKMNIDFLSASSYKISGPKGIAFLFKRKP